MASREIISEKLAGIAEQAPTLRERVADLRFSPEAQAAADARGFRLETARGHLLQILGEAALLAREIAAVAGDDDGVAALLEALA